MGFITLSSGRMRLLPDGGRHLKHLAQQTVNKNTIGLLFLIQEM